MISLMEKLGLVDLDERLRKIDCWFIGHTLSITRAMEEHRQKLVSSPEADAEWLDLTLWSLSEMPLCWSLGRIAREIPLPNFTLITPATGWIDVTYPSLGFGGKEGVSHGFMLDKRCGLVVCLSFGQFVLPLQENHISGGRINFVKHMAPDLVVVSGEVAMLRGNTEQIAKRLGLHYRERRFYE